MTTYGSNAARIYLNGTAPTNLLQSLELEQSVAYEDRTGIGNSVVYSDVVGIADAVVSMRGWFDGDWWQDWIGRTKPDVDAVLSVMPAGDSYGARCTMMNGVQASGKRIVERGGLTKMDAEFRSKAGARAGRVVAISTPRGAAGNTDSNGVDFAAASPTGGVFVAHLLALTLGGYTGLVISMRDSADGVTYAAVSGGPSLTFTAAYTAQWAVVAVNVRRYVSVAWSWTGSGSGQSATFWCGWSPDNFA